MLVNDTIFLLDDAITRLPKVGAFAVLRMGMAHSRAGRHVFMAHHRIMPTTQIRETESLMADQAAWAALDSTQQQEMEQELSTNSAWR